MRQIALAISCLFVIFSAAQAQTATPTFEAPEIALASSKYAEEIKGRVAAPDTSKAQTSLAAAWARKQVGGWTGAIRNYEDAIAYGADDAGVWMDLGTALLNGSWRDRRRAALAAWQAYLRADTDAKRGAALALVGLGLERINDHHMAIKAYRAALKLNNDRRLAERFAQYRRRYGFRYRSRQLDTTDESPRLCLTFSYELSSGRKVDYADYLQISPQTSFDVSATGRKLCIDGLSYGRHYTVNLRPGIPSSDPEERTERGARVEAAIPDRTAKLEFRGRAYILPKTGSSGVPLYSVNVEKADLRLLRINDRNLISQVVSKTLLGQLNSGSVAGIENTAGELVWKGTMDIAAKKNKEVATAFPISEALKKAAPGIYIVTAKPAGKKVEGYSDLATQWVLVSDLGLSSFRGADGLDVFLRSLDSARPVVGVTVKLYGRNNSELGAARTNAAGRATFDPGLLRGHGGNAPAAVLAYGPGGDFNFLDLTGAALDLSDRGVAGRAAPGPLDAYIYTERGIYRPGETAHIMALLRDNHADAVQGPPMTFRIVRPDGTDFRKTIIKPGPQGSYYLALSLPGHARTGQWSIRVYADPKGQAVGQAAIQVEDFVPERLALDLTADKTMLKTGGTLSLGISGRWLYGAPASGLRNTGDLVVTADKDPYPNYKGYQFGTVDRKWSAVRSPLSLPNTDKDGKATASITLPKLPESPQPIKAVARVTMLEPGGRGVTRSQSFKVRRHPFLIGIKPHFDGEVIGRGQEAAFDVIAVGPDGKRIDASGLKWEIVRERYNYRWYWSDDEWRYRVEIRDQPNAKGDIVLKASGPMVLSRRMDWGRYRLEVYDPASGAATSVRFRAGWFVSAAASDTPDMVEMSLDKPKYQPGETARVHIKPPYAGQALVTIASDRLHLTRSVSVPAEGATVEIPVDAKWSGGAYVTATVLRPGANGARRGPGRAIGAAWLTLDTSHRTLNVAVGGPTETRSERGVEVPITVTGVPAGEQAYITLAAVDEGILSLTAFASPDPLRHYFGKRALGVEMRDAYGRLIDGRAGVRGTIRSGGGADARRRHANSPDTRSTRAVAMFSGVVTLDAQGKAVIPLKIPQFAGKLRLMAVAFSKTRVGRGEGELLVRDPVVAQISLPRFLAPGDAANITLNLKNLSGPAGGYTVAMAASGTVKLTGETNARRTLDAKAQSAVKFTLTGGEAGVGKINLKLSGPDGYELARQWKIAVRPAQAVVTRHIVGALEPGQTVTIDRELAAEFQPGTAFMTASFSSGPNFDVPGLLASLSRYPYGCLEQTVSRAMPLLYLSSVSTAAGVKRNDDEASEVRGRVQDAIYRVLDMQRTDGSFSLWTWNGDREVWLSAYAMDFLRRAKKLGYDVPDADYKEGVAWLTSSVADGEYGGSLAPARTYALYVLSKMGTGNVGAARQYFDTWDKRLQSGLAKAQLASAFAQFGDQGRARKALGEAVAFNFASARYFHYGSPLRDSAAALTMLAESGFADNDTLFRLAEWVEQAMYKRQYTSTQEKAWLLLAAHAMFERQTDASVEVNGQPRTPGKKPVIIRPTADELKQGVVVRNTGNGALRQVVTASGVPRDPQPAEEKGLEVKRTVYSLDGKVADPMAMRQGDLYVVVVSGGAKTRLNHQSLVVDLLPAGLEIENTRLKHGSKMDNYAWLPKLTKTKYMEFRDDRFIAAVDLDGRGSGKDFRVAYLARAVTPGSYVQPAPYVEDMYKPQYHARGAMTKMAVAAR